jgi:hypothetical protein
MIGTTKEIHGSNVLCARFRKSKVVRDAGSRARLLETVKKWRELAERAADAEDGQS